MGCHSVSRKGGRKPDIALSRPHELGKQLSSHAGGILTTRTEVLEELRSGRRDAIDRLLPIVYQEMRVIAHRQLSVRGERDSLVTTALVHEAYLKLVDQSSAEWRDRAHFFALASVAMRHILVDRAKARTALKRGGVRRRITLEEDAIAIGDDAESLLEIDDALERLAQIAPRLARVVECRFYGGLTEEEIAEALGVTVRTVEREWAKARMLLRRMLGS